MRPCSPLILEQIINGIVTGSVYAIVAVGMTMIFGVLRAINFAHGEYYMLGTFGAWFAIDYFDLSYEASIVVGIAGHDRHSLCRRQARDAAHGRRPGRSRGARHPRHRPDPAEHRHPRLRRRLQVLLRRIYRAGLGSGLHPGPAAHADPRCLPAAFSSASN